MQGIDDSLAANPSKSRMAIDRGSHSTFFEKRDWSTVTNFWRAMLRFEANRMPQFIRGDSTYGLTDLHTISSLGAKEFSSSDPRFERKTFALRIGYNGSEYNGYQRQKGVSNVSTVEEDVFNSLGGRSTVAAGRTDKGVSALSQILSFHTRDDITAEQLRESFCGSAPCREGRLAVSEVVRVPRKFHALFSASWRRYLFIFPLSQGPYLPNGVDVDIQFVHEALQKLEGLALPYNGFAFREARDTGEGSSDICTMYRANATLIHLNEYIERRQSESESNNDNDKDNVTTTNVAVSSYTAMQQEQQPAVCIELVGSRFLRRMVRLLVGTAIRESVLPSADRDVEVLLRICKSGSRERASHCVPGEGLAMCGVGYDLQELSKGKHSINGSGGKKQKRGEKEKNRTDQQQLTNSVGGESAGGKAENSLFDSSTRPMDQSECCSPRKRPAINVVLNELKHDSSNDVFGDDADTIYNVRTSCATAGVDGHASNQDANNNDNDTNDDTRDAARLNEQGDDDLPAEAGAAAVTLVLEPETASVSPNEDDERKSDKEKGREGEAEENKNMLWLMSFIDELNSFDAEKLYYPQRVFEFHSLEEGGPGTGTMTNNQTVLVDQNISNVGHTVWDAEIILAHFMESFMMRIDSSGSGSGSDSDSISSGSIGVNTSCSGSISTEVVITAAAPTTSVLELGAGCAIAAVVAARKGAYVAVQELPDVLSHTVHCLQMNGCDDSVDAFAALWGPECLHAITQLRGVVNNKRRLNKKDCRREAEEQEQQELDPLLRVPAVLFDYVIMADVLYHVEDFQLLISTIDACLSERGCVIVSYEQRRRDLKPFFDQLDQHLRIKELHKFTVRQDKDKESRRTQNDDDYGGDGGGQRETTFFLHVYGR